MKPRFAALGGAVTFITTLLLTAFICSGQPSLKIPGSHMGEMDRYGEHDTVGDILMGHPDLKKFLANYPQTEELLFVIRNVWSEPSPYYANCRIQYCDPHQPYQKSLSARTKAGV